LRSPLSTVPAGIIVLTFTTVAFDQSGPRWLGISDLIAEPEGPTFISYKVARSRLDRLRFVTQDPERTFGKSPKIFHLTSPNVFQASSLDSYNALF
jgi:hypothetical protein